MPQIKNNAPTQALRENPYVSPLLADDHSGLPPALIVTATFDPLRDQGEAYAKRLLDAGVPVTLHREQSLHGFMGSLDRLEKIQSMAATKLRETFQN